MLATATTTTTKKRRVVKPGTNGNGKRKAVGVLETDVHRGLSDHREVAEGGENMYEIDGVVAHLCKSLQELQRERVSHLKSRIMLDNQLTSSVAVSLGYRSGLDEAERKEAFDAARAVIEKIRKGETGNETESHLAPLILEASRFIAGFDRYVGFIEKRMVKAAEKLPVADWVKQPKQRGFGLLSLAILVGECGDLANYANPGKLWRRMGCAPFESDGVMRMGSRWKSAKPGLSAAEWEEFGYCPRRRSIAFVFGENLVKQNSVAGEGVSVTEGVNASDGSPETGRRHTGPYRRRYDEVKAAKLALQSDDWPKLRCHRHAMLLATKLLMRELWKAWNPERVREQSW